MAVARAAETVEVHQAHLQRRRTSRQGAPCRTINLARDANSVLHGLQKVECQDIGPLIKADGTLTNECPHCHALRWPNETGSICCSGGKIKLEPLPHPPDAIKQLWGSNTTEGRIFRDYSRQLNNALALASQKVNEPSPPGSSWKPSVVIQGKLYHFVGPLQANAGKTINEHRIMITVFIPIVACTPIVARPPPPILWQNSHANMFLAHKISDIEGSHKQTLACFIQNVH
jgi:hypothetical protein